MSNVDEWRYVDSKQNPADLLSRGVFANEISKLTKWLHGPDFLLLNQDHWPSPEGGVYDASAFTISTNADCHADKMSLLERFSNVETWIKLLQRIAWLMRFKRFLLNKREVKVGVLSLQEVRCATTEVMRLLHLEEFPTELAILRQQESTKQIRGKAKQGLRRLPSRLSKLNPILVNGIIRVGGRLQHAPLPFETKHPIVLPSNHYVTRLIVQHYHVINGHCGFALLHSYLRQRFWILRATKTIKSILYSCFKCRRWFSRPFEQVMAPLPTDRTLSNQDPFTVTGVDYFGPLYVKRKRSIEKRYGCLFTCLSSRAVHIEVAETLDTDSFLCAFTRFVARRGCPQRLYSDNGSNFKAAEMDIKVLLKQWNQEKIQRELLIRECDWVFHPPKASHRGGIWERIIRSIKCALTVILEEQPINDEVLHTTLLEIERILNDRPLVKQSDDPEDLYVLNPNKLLMLKGNPSVPPPAEISCRRFNRRWHQAQYLADLFWKHWLRRYLPCLQIRQCWTQEKPEVKVGELVLMRDDSVPRGQWPKAIIEDTAPGADGLIRDVVVRTAQGRFRRDIRQLCKLEGDTPIADEDVE